MSEGQRGGHVHVRRDSQSNPNQQEVVVASQEWQQPKWKRVSCFALSVFVYSARHVVGVVLCVVRNLDPCCREFVEVCVRGEGCVIRPSPD